VWQSPSSEVIRLLKYLPRTAGKLSPDKKISPLSFPWKWLLLRACFYGKTPTNPEWSPLRKSACVVREGRHHTSRRSGEGKGGATACMFFSSTYHFYYLAKVKEAVVGSTWYVSTQNGCDFLKGINLDYKNLIRTFRDKIAVDRAGTRFLIGAQG